MMNSWILVMAGGALGAGLRHGVGRILPATLAGMPLPTLAVNVVGGLAMGMLAGWLARGHGGEELRLLLGVGVLGGFTTFSAFSLEAMQMIERGTYGLFAGYALASVTLSIAALAIGMGIVRSAAT